MALGIAPSYILDEMPLYEAQQCLGAYEFKDAYLLTAIRQSTFLNLSVWTSEAVDMHELMPLPFDKKENKVEDKTEINTAELLERSKDLVKGIKI